MVPQIKLVVVTFQLAGRNLRRRLDIYRSVRKCLVFKFDIVVTVVNLALHFDKFVGKLNADEFYNERS